ncbi:MAG: cell division protein [Clostridioides difficile]|nr:cell division protein [Clostridioides sp.]MBS5787365.1 cell division protein [Clostridioides difficile]
MDQIEKNSKIIAIGDEGINNLNYIKDDILCNMGIEKLTINQDVDKEYIRSIFDGVDVLFLIYSSKDKRTSEIVKAISYMSLERRVLSIGLNSSDDDEKEDLGLNREFYLNVEDMKDFTNIMNLLVKSISEETLLYLDTTDLKEVIANEKGIGYSYIEFNKNENYSDVANKVISDMRFVGSEFLKKKGILLIEGKINLDDVKKLTDHISEIKDDNYDIIFSLNLEEHDENILKICLIHN